MAKESLINNLVGGWSTSDIRIANLSDSVNMYVETCGTGASSTQMLRSIYGNETLLQISDKQCTGIFECSRGPAIIDGKPLLFAAFENELYAVYYNNSTHSWAKELITNELSTGGTPISMCETGGEGSAHPHLVIVDGANCYAVDTTLEWDDMRADWRSLQLPKSKYQPDETNTRLIRPTHVAYCYNYIIINDASTDGFYISYQYPFEVTKDDGSIDYDIFMCGKGATYEDNGFVTYAEWSPDNITALISNNTYIYTFGPKSTQIFTYNSDVDAPFISPTNCANGIGIKAEHSLACVSDYVFFLGNSSIGENGIFQWQGNNISKISTPEIERYISNLDNKENVDVSDAIGQCWLEEGHLFYSISFITGDYTLVYDLTEKLWHRRSTKDKLANTQHYWRFNFATLHQNKLIFGTDNGYLVYLKTDKFNEFDDRPIIRIRKSGMIMSNYQDFIVDKIKLVCNNGDHKDISLNPQVMMRYCENGGNWSNQEICLLGKQGDYGYTTEWWNLGVHNILCVEVSISDPVNFAIMGGQIQYSEID